MPYVSYGGGARIIIKGVGLDTNTFANTILLESVTAGQQRRVTIPAPRLSEDDAFYSQPQFGMITYRLPSLSVLFGRPMEMFMQYDRLDFYVSVLSNKAGATPLACDAAVLNHCKVTYHKLSTPMIYYLSPPVVFYGTTADIIFD